MSHCHKDSTHPQIFSNWIIKVYLYFNPTFNPTLIPYFLKKNESSNSNEIPWWGQFPEYLLHISKEKENLIWFFSASFFLNYEKYIFNCHMTISQLTQWSLYNKTRDPLILSARLFLSDTFSPKTELFKAEQQNAVEENKSEKKNKGICYILIFQQKQIQNCIMHTLCLRIYF